MAGALASLLGSHPAAAGRTAITFTASGNAQVDTAQSKFGGASALFDGTGDWIQTTNNLQTLCPLTSDFTLEMFVRFNTLPTSGNFRMLFGTASANQYLTLWNDGGTYRIQVAITGGGGTLYRAWSFGTTSTGTWYHLAVSKSSTNILGFKDGTQLTSPSDVGTFSSSRGITGDTANYIGRWSNATTYQHNGWLDEIRLSKTARYTGSFTAPTAAFTNDSNTVFLLHCDGTDASTTFTDDNA